MSGSQRRRNRFQINGIKAIRQLNLTHDFKLDPGSGKKKTPFFVVVVTIKDIFGTTGKVWMKSTDYITVLSHC